MSTKQLRFAAFIRVSTEKQEKQGSSLSVQRTSIERDVKALSGKIVKWYGGQEHATPGWEKKELDRLLRDADRSRPKFDAVIVAYQDRWSRDNAKSQQGLEVLKARDIRFFVGQKEFDLYNPEDLFVLGINAVIGGYFAGNQAKKSIENRIDRARTQNRPACGKLPYGRTFDADKLKWDVDPIKKQKIEDAAARYLAGESLKDIAAENGMSLKNLHTILMKRSGPKWEQHFNNTKYNIHETIITTVPTLLDAPTIRALRKRAKANRTYGQRHQKNRYLLRNFLFCGKCGYALTGQPNHNKLVYRHHSERGCKDRPPRVSANMIEKAVLKVLFEAFGNPVAVERAVQAALPDIEKTKRLQRQREQLEKQLVKAKKGRQRVITLARKELISEDEQEEQLKASRSEIAELEAKLTDLGDWLDSQPTAKQIKAAAKDIKRRVRRVSKAKVWLNAAKNIANNKLDDVTWEDARALMELVFGGNKRPDGKPCGVYVWAISKKKNNLSFRFEIHGTIINTSGSDPVYSISGGNNMVRKGRVTLSPSYLPRSKGLPLRLTGTIGVAA